MKKNKKKYPSPETVFSEQLRAARALIRMSQDELVDRSGVSIATVRRLEGKDGPLPARSDSGNRMIEVLVDAGVKFIGASEKAGLGVRLESPGLSPGAWRTKP